jgi:hypothetical protein
VDAILETTKCEGCGVLAFSEFCGKGFNSFLEIGLNAVKDQFYDFEGTT